MYLDHPMITQIEKYGYPLEYREGLQNVVDQLECNGIDFYGTEILEGDSIVIDTENFSEIILREHLKRYLKEKVFFSFHQVSGMDIVLDESRLKVFAEQDLEKVLHEDYGFEFKVAE